MCRTYATYLRTHILAYLRYCCSTVDLLGLLNWISDPNHVTDNLAALMKVNGEEVVKFLQDVLDALFNILMLNSDSDLLDEMVFNCLVSRP